MGFVALLEKRAVPSVRTGFTNNGCGTTWTSSPSAALQAYIRKVLSIFKVSLSSAHDDY
jgi:hypothetical protein